MQEADAERRIQILRGLPVIDAPPRSPSPARKERSRDKQDNSHDDGARRERKRRRIAGEDDTERDIRLALEDRAAMPGRQEMSLKPSKGADVSLTDSNGHINLFPTQSSRRGHASKNAEAEADATRKKREFEDQYTMRFSNAAGFKNAVGEKPWYHSMGTAADQGGGENEADGSEPVSKDVWGNEDPRRKEREKARLAADDPLAVIQKGVSGLREVERERKEWQAEKEQETRELIREEKRRSRKRRSHHHHHNNTTNDDDNDDDLENFSLEAPAMTEPRSSIHESSQPHARHRHHRHHHHEHDKHRRHHHHRPYHRNSSNDPSNQQRDHSPSRNRNSRDSTYNSNRNSSSYPDDYKIRS